MSLGPGGPQSAGEWRRARDLCRDRAVLKFTLPGPMTLMDGMVNLYYDSEEELAADLVTAINQEVLELARAGCEYIQLDEPVMMRYPDKALAFGLDNLAKCFAGLPQGVGKVRVILARQGLTDRQLFYIALCTLKVKYVF